MAKYRHAKGPSNLHIVLIVLASVLVLAAIVFGVFKLINSTPEKEIETPPTQPVATQPVATKDEAPTEAPTEDPQLKYTSQSKDYLGSMSEDEKIYQMFIVTPEALTGVDVATIAGDATKEAIKNKPVAGIYYSAGNFEDEEQITELLKNTQSFSKTPMFLALTDEGGESSPLYSKFSTAKNNNIYKHDSNYAGSLALGLSKFGINMNLAPCANLEGDNIFSTEAKSAGDGCASVVDEFTSKGIISVVKHFPVATDSTKTTDELIGNETHPFAASIDRGAGVVMMSSAKLSSIDNVDPAFMSHKVVQEFLIDGFKFDKVVMTPNLSSDSIKGVYEPTQVVVGSIKAGVNLFLCPDDIDAYVKAVKDALKNGDITQEQIDNSVEKILALKFEFGLIKNTEPVLTPSEGETEAPTLQNIDTN